MNDDKNHFTIGGAESKLIWLTFHPELPDPYKQRAGSRAGAMSILIGIAAVRVLRADSQ